MLIPHKVKNKGKYISFHYLRGWKARKIRKVQEISPQIPILVLQEFRKPDIVEKIRDFIGCQAGFSDHALLQEIQKFMTVHLDPQGIILYMDVLGNQPAARNVYKQGGQMW